MMIWFDFRLEALLLGASERTGQLANVPQLKPHSFSSEFAPSACAEEVEIIRNDDFLELCAEVECCVIDLGTLIGKLYLDK